MKDELFGLAVAMIAVSIVVPLVMLIPGREYVLDMLPYTLPMLLIGVWLLRVSMKPAASVNAPTDDSSEEKSGQVSGSAS